MELPTNKHHFFWQKNDYKRPPFNALRQATLEIVDIDAHNELHAHLLPPVKPSLPLAHDLNDYLRRRSYTQPFGNILAVIEYLDANETIEREALADHLIAQLGYVATEL